MNATGYAVLGLTVIVSVLIAILVFSVLRFAAAARDSRRESRQDTAFLSSALEEAITKLKAQERATAARAEASERLSGEIVASLTSGLLLVDRDNRVQIANPAARRILSVEELPPKTDYRVVLAGATALADVIGESLRSNLSISRRTVTVGGATHLGVSVSPLGAEDVPSGAICLFTDLTNVVALEEQLRLKDSLARLGELTAGLAHEFRNGLATIHGYGRLLDPAALPAQYRPYVEGIRSETQALGDIVTNFLRFAKPEALTLAPLELPAVVRRAAEDVPAAKVDVQGEFAPIEGDEVLLRQAFSNLIRNSVEACSVAGVEPRIGVTGAIDSRLRTMTVELRDNGPGIRPEAVAQIFNPFFTTRPGGTGLGLAIVQKVFVSHNGLITAANNPAGGALFRIVLPLVDPSTPPD